jgi:hypothetical protein
MQFQIITEREDFEKIAMQMVQMAIDKMPAQTSELKPDIRTGEQVCEGLSISLQTLMLWRKKGKIPYLKIGSSIRYDYNKVIAALEVVNKKGVSK